MHRSLSEMGCLLVFLFWDEAGIGMPANPVKAGGVLNPGNDTVGGKPAAIDPRLVPTLGEVAGVAAGSFKTFESSSTVTDPCC